MILQLLQIMRWIDQICRAERHIDKLEEELNIGIIYDIKVRLFEMNLIADFVPNDQFLHDQDIYLKWGSNGYREVKVRIHPLPSLNDKSRVKSMRQSNVMSIFARLLPVCLGSCYTRNWMLLEWCWFCLENIQRFRQIHGEIQEICCWFSY